LPRHRAARDTGFAPAFDVAAAVADGKITEVTHHGTAGPRPAGMVMEVDFELASQKFTALNGGRRGLPLGGQPVLETLNLGPDRLVCLLVRGADQAHRVVDDPPLQQHHDAHSSSVVPTLASAPAR
jgi:3-demethylubiquinone-9 3-methyltransferase